VQARTYEMEKLLKKKIEKIDRKGSHKKKKKKKKNVTEMRPEKERWGGERRRFRGSKLALQSSLTESLGQSNGLCLPSHCGCLLSLSL
jgi:hypothetical protein